MAGILFARCNDDYEDPSYPGLDVLAVFEAHGALRVARAAAAGYTYTDVNSDVRWDTVKPYMSLGTYELFFHSGHGNSRKMSGNQDGTGTIFNPSYHYVIDTNYPDSYAYLTGLAVYSFACSTANELMTRCILSGAIMYAGYSQNYGFTMVDGALDDIYFVSTMAGGFKFLESLIDGKTSYDSYVDAIAEWDSQYAYWTTGDGSGDGFASVCASTILAQKQSFILGGTSAYTFQLASPSADVGTIEVSTDNASATFSISGPSSYSGSGLSWSQLNAPIGSYTITYGDVAGYITPDDETLELTNGATITFTGTYAASPADGTITVTTNLSGASFSIVGPETFNGTGTSYITTEASPGTYTITFGAVVGYNTPSSQIKTVSSGGITQFTGTYTTTANDGTINVTTNSSSASFYISGPEYFSGTGTSYSTSLASPGTYTIVFGPVSGYTTPASQVAVLTSGGTISFTGTYVAIALGGTINVSTNLSSATFTIVGPETLSGSGTSYSDSGVTAGSYTITYGSVAGYTTPSPETQVLADGATVTFTGTYAAIASNGTIVVNTNVSASFSLSGPATYSDTGTSTTITQAPVGTYTITYGNVSGYSTPASSAQVLTASGTITFTGTYTAQASTGTITVTTNNDDCTFSIAGPNLYSGSGRYATFTGVPTGIYSIVYSDVTGYDKPGAQIDVLSASGTIAFIGNYTKITASEIITGSDIPSTINYNTVFTFGRFTRLADDPKHFLRTENSPLEAPYPLLPCFPALPVDAHINRFEFKSLYDVNTNYVWEERTDGLGTSLLPQNERGGIAKFINDSSDNNYYFYLSRYEVGKLSASKGIWLNAGIRIYDVDEADWFFGLSTRITVGATIFDNRIDAIGFYGSDGSASINAECRKNYSETQETAIDTLTDNTFKRLHIYIEGTSRVYFYSGGIYKTQIVSNLPDDEEMCIVFGCRNGKREANQFSITQINLLQDI